jgi:hypothetical protein
LLAQVFLGIALSLGAWILLSLGMSQAQANVLACPGLDSRLPYFGVFNGGSCSMSNWAINEERDIFFNVAPGTEASVYLGTPPGNFSDTSTFDVSGYYLGYGTPFNIYYNVPIQIFQGEGLVTVAQFNDVGSTIQPDGVNGEWKVVLVLTADAPDTYLIAYSDPPLNTPLPTTLILFITGFAGLTLLVWCRKQRAQAVA